MALRFKTTRDWLAVLTSAAIFCTGCVKMQIDMVGRSTSVAPLVQPVRHDGVYVAMWTPDAKAHLQPLAETPRQSFKGDKLGFERIADGSIVAIHNAERIPLPQLPANAKYVVWYHCEPVRTNFARQSSKVAQQIVEGTVTVVIVAGVAAIVAYSIYYHLKYPQKCDQSDF